MLLILNILFYFYNYLVLEFDLFVGKYFLIKVIYVFKMEEGCYIFLLYYGKIKKIIFRFD